MSERSINSWFVPILMLQGNLLWRVPVIFCTLNLLAQRALLKSSQYDTGNCHYHPDALQLGDLFLQKYNCHRYRYD